MCSSSASRSSRARSRGPTARSNGRRLSSRSARCRASHCSSAASRDRSTTGRSTLYGGWTIWPPCPSSASNVVRSDSCRVTSRLSAARRAAASSGPRSRNAVGVTYTSASGSNWCRNHSRCWAGDSGSAPSRGAAGIGADVPAAGSAAASPATVGVLNSARGETLTPKAARIREVTRMLRMESPPSSKKSHSTPTRSSPRTPAQITASSHSTAVRGATYRLPSAGSSFGAGSARRSSFPLGVSGSASRVT